MASGNLDWPGIWRNILQLSAGQRKRFMAPYGFARKLPWHPNLAMSGCRALFAALCLGSLELGHRSIAPPLSSPGIRRVFGIYNGRLLSV